MNDRHSIWYYIGWILILIAVINTIIRAINNIYL